MRTNEGFLCRQRDAVSPTGITTGRPLRLQRSPQSEYRVVSVATTTPTHNRYPRQGADGGFVNKFRVTEGVR